MGNKQGNPVTINASALDEGATPLVGKRVFYQLTDEEGGTPEFRKVPAIIYRRYFDGRTNEKDQKLHRIQFVSPDGQVHLKDAPRDSSREPGTWEITQPGDLT